MYFHNALRRCSFFILVMVVLGLLQPAVLTPTAAAASQRAGQPGAAEAGQPQAEPGALSQQSASSVLFVVGTTPIASGSGDSAVQARLVSLGYTVVVKNQSVAVAADAAGQALVIISSSVSAGTVAAKFRDVTVPVITWETGIYDDMQLTGFVSPDDYGSASGVSSLTITAAGHPLAAGLTGSVVVFSSAQTTAYGTPSNSAIKVAPSTTSSSKAAYFAYESGAAMVGLSAPLS